MIPLGNQVAREQQNLRPPSHGAVVLGLVGLPVAVWLDLRNLSERTLRNQVARSAGSSTTCGPSTAASGGPRAARAAGPGDDDDNYRDVPGAIPIPATLSIELGKRISAHDGSVKYRFVSDLPFRGREAHPLERFRAEALAALRANPSQSIVEVSGSLLDRQVRAAAPVVMGAGLRELPQHPSGQSQDRLESRRRARHPGDLGGPADRRQRLSFKYLLVYFGLAALAGLTFILLQRRQSALVEGMNRELGPPTISSRRSR